ncbi:MAG: hypothetical protein H7A46_02890 [Verrucomicrobiales bacterium]|nr:hypothetical protein [Verrucomicrobiales bacterium]
MKGEPMYNVVYPREWEAGMAQRRIDGLIRMIPELRDGHTIHVDVFIAQREDDDLFVPALWNPREIIAYSRDGYVHRAWRLPEDWQGVNRVHLHRITLKGLVLLDDRVGVDAGRLTLSLQPDEAVSISPAEGGGRRKTQGTR